MIKLFVTRARVLLPAAAMAAVFCGCGSRAQKSDASISNLPTVPVHVQTVEDKSRTMTDEVVGTVRAKLHATLEARLSGRIAEMPVALGDSVQKGQIIARLDAAEIAARLEQAQASLDEANRDWKRVSALFEQQSVTRAEYDASLTRQQIAKAAVAEAKAMMSYVNITAPFDGVITKKWVDVGDLAAPGKPLIDVEDPSALQFLADVPDTLVGNIKLGDKLKVRIATDTNQMEGAVAEISPAADPNSRTFLVKFNLPGAPELRSGRFGRVAVPVGDVTAIHAPVSAVIQRGQMEQVFVVTDGHAELRLIKTGQRIGDEVEVVSGLNSDEQVVSQDALELTDGQPVTIQK